MNLFIEKIKEDLLNPFLSSLSLSSIQSSPQSFSQSALQEIQETDEDVFIEKNIEIETNLNQPVNMSGLLKMVRTKLYENLCKYWNFQDSNALLASLLDPRTKNLKH
ncbi:11272_t:CDS:1, partial [Rhizophagus irregularis]